MSSKEYIFNTMLYIIFAVIRIFVIVLAIYMSYLFIKKLVTPKVLVPTCLYETNSCVKFVFYKYKNSFIGRVFPSSIVVWFNGRRLYVYNQAPGNCQDTEKYEPVDCIEITGNNLNPKFKREPYKCILRSQSVFDYYRAILNNNEDPFVIYIKPSNDILDFNFNVYDLFSEMISRGYISVDNINTL